MQIIDLKNYEGKNVTLNGWVANKREGKGIAFIILRDGSGFAQCVVSAETAGAKNLEVANSISMESAVCLTGKVVNDKRQIGGYEVQVIEIALISMAEEYPISKKAHGVDFLTDNRHLWLRTRRQWAIMRIRNAIIFSIHNFFQQRGFVQMDAPIFTGNACEGTSDLFEVNYFDSPAFLTQSGQLYGEAMAMAMGKIYTFGPTFRSEKSRTRRHLTEFWMIEPEMAFYDNDMNMDLIEEFIHAILKDVLQKCREEFTIIERDVSKLEKATEKFPRFSYDEAVSMLHGEKEVNGISTIACLENDLNRTMLELAETEKEIAEREMKISAPGMKKGEVNFNRNKIDVLKNRHKELVEQQQNIPQWIRSAKDFKYGSDFGGSDETVLTRLFNTPIMIYNWPHECKAFYMKRDKAHPNLAKGVDVLAPEGYGEIVGGGERETDKDLLIQKIHEHKLSEEAFSWYLDLRRYGSVPHAGFGLGLERVVAWICGLNHVRETIPFPRWYGRLSP